jgi:hypothetical protein
METANEILGRARARKDARDAAYVPIDYARMNREGRKLKAQLTRAVNQGRTDKVVLACAHAVKVWDEVGAWPDDWSLWQRALDDCFRFGGPDLSDLR